MKLLLLLALLIGPNANALTWVYPDDADYFIYINQSGEWFNDLGTDDEVDKFLTRVV